jgi:type I restriction enzyme M protein
MPSQKKGTSKTNKTKLSFEDKLWKAADKLRGHLDAAEYKHVVLGLIFLKYISDVFEARYQQLQKEDLADPEDRDEYTRERIFWVPEKARWAYLQNRAKTPEIGSLIDGAMEAIENENGSLNNVLPKIYNKPELERTILGELVDLIGSIQLATGGKSRDILGEVYEYFLGHFASAEGKKGGQFYTPGCVVRLLVEMLKPSKGRVYDPCCGSGGMFVQSERLVEAGGGDKSDIFLHGQESNPTTWKLCKMNLAIRGVEVILGEHHADSFQQDLHRGLKADFILANPPFNASEWGGKELTNDVRWKYGTPPAGNANFAWVQHIIYHLGSRGYGGFVLANGSMSSNQSGEGEIREKIVEAGLVDCMVALPGQLFYNTQIPACLWFVTKDKRGRGKRDRSGETLFIDARKLGVMRDRVRRELTGEELERIAATYHAWRGDKGAGDYEDVAGFCKGATTEEIRENGYVLTPGRYVGAEEVEDDEEPFEERMGRLVRKLRGQFAESAKLEKEIRENFKELGL